MPQYIYVNPNNESEFVEIIQTMSEPHIYFRDNIQWRREFTVPTSSIDTKFDCMNSKDFANKTNKKDTLGSLFDRAKELGQKREQIMGRDEIAIKHKQEYKARRNGKDLSEGIANNNKTFVV